MSLQWYGDEATQHVRGKAVGFLNRSAMLVTRRSRQLLSIAGTAVGRGGTGKFKRVYGAVTSKPGEPPRKQRGTLRASVAMEVDEKTMRARVGTNLKYGKYLELGTKRGLAPRPWLRRALAEMQSQINQLLSSGPGDNS